LQVSASDCAYAISSLLEFPHHINAHSEEEAAKAKANALRNQQNEGKEDVSSRDFAHQKMLEKIN